MRNSKMTPARLGAIAGAGMAAALLAACSSGGSSSSAPAAGGSAASGSASGSSNSGAMVITTASAGGTTFLTTGSGRAVYLWVKDTSGQSACTGACAGAWPPVTASSVTASGGAKASDLSTITRSDGTKQVTYDGHALYYYVGDSGAGQATGQGSDQFGAKWWLVSPAGANVTGSVASFTPGSTGSGGSSPSAPATGSSSKSGWA